MTRKRYVKLLMACGYSRDDVAWIARDVQTHRASYRGDLVCWLAAFSGGAWYGPKELRREANILRYALYGEVAHE
nr:MAG TPA: hypothetical protein [Caudoviricetes sp.]